ncbi:MAG TPA: NAD(P)/FAD-dependent oxidoreductase, partial [Gaiellaceae bacterium]|nr:NAD(P)/FAD-dependent oxidoreductase [Gaiellaceae bacterium]
MTKRVVIVGGGFGGLLAARGLRGAGFDVTVVDRQNFFLFQPLAYQVATGSLSSVEVALPLRRALRRDRNTHVVLGDVTGFDLEQRLVHVANLPTGGSADLPYDVLAVAVGSGYSYFGHDEWAEHAPELKTLDGALRLRDRILLAFESAELEQDEAARQAWLTFAVVGAGPTGVEMAGQIAELARDVLPDEYRRIDTRRARVLLVEAGDRVLAAFSERLSASARRQLESLGVTPLLQSLVVDIDADSLEIERRDGSREHIPSRTKVWAAGVAASPLAAQLGETDRAGRVLVEPDLTLAGHPEVFVFGDMVSVRGQELHGVAPVAMQQGRHVARSIRSGERKPFRYRDKGELATIGRARAVGTIGRVPVTGFLAWALWLGIHITYLVGFQNRVLVLTRWAFAYVTRGRSARIIHR